MSTLLITHSCFVDHDTGPGHPERPDRFRAVEEALRREHAMLGNEHIFLAFAQVEWDTFAEVMRADFTIMEDASKKDVMLAGPLVLIPLLRADGKPARIGQ